MGVDLKLLVVEGDQGTWGFAHTMLELDRDYPLHKLIQALKPYERPTFRFSSFVSRVPDGSVRDEYCYGEVKETPYGERLTFVDSLDLATVLDSDPETGPRNKAAAAYLRLIPRTTVALYWH